MINTAVLTGRLTKTVDLRYTSNGTAYASFTLAVDRNFKDATGNKQTDFINCVAWKKTAEILANYTQKGSLVGVEGRIQTRSYDNQQGQKVYVTEVLTENLTFLESRKANDTSDYSQDGINNKNQNTGGSFANNDPFTAEGEVFEVEDDDLPF